MPLNPIRSLFLIVSVMFLNAYHSYGQPITKTYIMADGYKYKILSETIKAGFGEQEFNSLFLWNGQSVYRIIFREEGFIDANKPFKKTSLNAIFPMNSSNNGLRKQRRQLEQVNSMDYTQNAVENLNRWNLKHNRKADHMIFENASEGFAVYLTKNKRRHEPYCNNMPILLATDTPGRYMIIKPYYIDLYIKPPKSSKTLYVGYEHFVSIDLIENSILNNRSELDQYTADNVKEYIYSRTLDFLFDGFPSNKDSLVSVLSKFEFVHQRVMPEQEILDDPRCLNCDTTLKQPKNNHPAIDTLCFRRPNCKLCSLTTIDSKYRVEHHCPISLFGWWSMSNSIRFDKISNQNIFLKIETSRGIYAPTVAVCIMYSPRLGYWLQDAVSYERTVVKLSSNRYLLK